MAWVVTASPGGASVTVGGAATTATLLNLTNGTAYTVVVHGLNGVGAGPDSTPSAPATPGRAPSAPTAVQLVEGNGALTVNWAAPADSGGYPVTSYVVAASPGASSVMATSTSATLSGLTNGTAYTVTVRAVNAMGTSAASTPGGPATPGTVPTAPSGVTATAGNASALVSWTAPADTGGRALTGYAVTASPGGAVGTTTGATSTTMSGLTNGTAYTFTVKALNALGAGPDSAPSAAVTPASVPGAATSVTATAGQGSISVSWAAPTDTGGLPVTQFRVTAAPGGSTVTSTATSTTFTSLAAGVSYTFTVAAANSLGFGPESAASNATSMCSCSTTSTCCDGCFPRAVGGVCSDGKFCTVGEVCQTNGTCGAGTPKDCTGLVAVSQCQQPSCDATLDVCVAAAKPDSTACNDANLCTTTDVCVSGACVGQSPVTCPETECLQAGTCAPATGVCSAAPKADGLACTGPANTEAQCVTGACQAMSCVSGFGDCTTTSPDCETDLRSDVNSCGLCGQACRTGNRFLHARTRCANAGCVFLGCDPGWQDADGDCTTGAESCNTGCEACQVLGDGSFDIPDDGADNDCTGGDSTNTDALGWYVDSSFTPTGTAVCPGGAARGTRDCPFTSLYDVTFAASQQSWMAPGPSRRYVYVAQGNYVDVGTVFETTVPLIYAGGYVHTGTGAWTRNGTATVVTSSTAGATVLRLLPSAGWAALDRVTLTQPVDLTGRVSLRQLAAGASVPRLNVVAGTPQLLHLQSVDAFLNNATVGATMLAGWQIIDSRIRSAPSNIIFASTNLIVQSSEIVGHLMGISSPTRVVVRDSQLGGAEGTGGAPMIGTFADSQFSQQVALGSSTYPSQLAVRRCTFSNGVGRLYYGIFADSIVSGAGSQFSSCTLKRNWIAGALVLIDNSVIENNRFSDFVRLSYRSNAANNLFLGGVEWQSTSGQTPGGVVFSSNYVQAGSRPEALTLTAAPGVVITNNIFARGSAPASTNAIVESSTAADPMAVLNNAFIGFAPANLYLDEGTSPLADVSRLNTLSQLSACARGGNVAFDTDAQAGLRSSDPLSPLVGRITTGPLVDAARPLPYTCDGWTLTGSTTDFTSANARVCRTAQDIGAYEVCP